MTFQFIFQNFILNICLGILLTLNVAIISFYKKWMKVNINT